MVNLQEKLDAVQSRLAALLGTLQGEKEENEKLKSELVNVTQNLLSSEEHVSRLNEEVQQMTSKCENLTSQFIIQNGINKEYEAKIDLLRTEIQSNKLNMSEKVCQIKNIQAKIDLLGKKAMGMKTMELDDSSLVSSESYTNGTLTGTSPTKERGSTFHCAIEALWNECQQVVKVSSEKSHQIQKLEEHLASLREEIKSIKLQNGQLELKLSRAAADGKVYQVTATEHLRVLVTESQSLLDVEKHRTLELSQKLLELEKKKTGYEAKVQELDDLLKSIENKNSNLEELLLQKTSAIADLQQKCLASEDMIQMLNDGENKLKGEMDEMKDKFKDLQQFLEEKENHEEKRNPETERLRKELQEFSAKEQTLKLDLEIKHEQYIDLKEKLADSKKQIQQVDKEISTMRDEKKLLCNKINEYEKIKNQMSLDLDMKRRVIQQLQKEKVDSEKMELNQKYQTELPVKDKIIEDMRLTLLEQEQTQAEQEQALEAKTKEALNLAAELEKWKHSCNVLENITLSQQNQTASEKPDVNNPLPDSLQMCQETLKEWEEKHNNERKKWNVEKIVLLNQLKEAENQRNREMRRFAEDRERHLKQQTEFELLSVQMSEKERDLQKWREERDELVAALEVQLNSLVSSNLEKDNEIEHLQGKTIQTSELAINHQVENKVSPALSLQHSCRESEMQVKSDSSIYSTIDKSEDRSDIVLDSSGLSTEDGKTSRFPKPQMEIQFTPLTPNRMEVTHQGSLSPVTVKINRPLRKRKSHEMDEDIVRSENKKNANPGRSRTPCSPSTPASNNRKAFDRKGSSLKKQISTSSTPSKKEGALQKIGDFLHSSPTIFQSKAKKLMETISSSKLTGDESCKENQSKTKRSRRKLYTTDISAPFDVPSHPIIMDKNEKESDHLIMKRRLRSKTAK